TPEQRAEISAKYNQEEIAQFRADVQKKTKANYARALELAELKGWPLRIVEEGYVAILTGVTDDDQPLYKGTDNAGAAITARVPAVRTGGSLGLDLNGQDMILGMWEIGNVRATHIDLNGRVTVQDGAVF